MIDWIGNLPTKCDLCKEPLAGQEFYDGKTIWGIWATMCSQCFRIAGTGVGVGRGQHYDKEGRKVEG